MSESNELHLTDEQVDNMCRYVVDLCKLKLFTNNKFLREENEKLKNKLKIVEDICLNLLDDEDFRQYSESLLGIICE